LKYEEEYELALESFSRAQALDPTWKDPEQKEKQLIKYLDSVQELVSLKGKLKGKKLQQMVQVRSGDSFQLILQVVVCKGTNIQKEKCVCVCARARACACIHTYVHA
jgi:hypothetical protein